MQPFSFAAGDRGATLCATLRASRQAGGMRDTGTDFARWVRLALIEAGTQGAVAAAFVLEMRKQFAGTRHYISKRRHRDPPESPRTNATDSAGTSGPRR